MRLDDKSRLGSALPQQPVPAAAGLPETDRAAAAPAIAIIPLPTRERPDGTGQVP